jgi:hypothetical protein
MSASDNRGPSRAFTRSGRVAAGLLASIAWLGLVRYGVAEVSKQDGDWLAALWTNAGHLTDLSNLLLAIVMTGVAAGSRALSRPAIVGWAVAAIATVGVGFWMIGGTLTLGTSALEDILLHAVTPWAAVLFWLVFVPKGALRRAHALSWMFWPMAYWAYAAIVNCKACKCRWTSRQDGGGSFYQGIGWVVFTCPSCSKEGRVTLRVLSEP